MIKSLFFSLNTRNYIFISLLWMCTFLMLSLLFKNWELNELFSLPKEIYFIIFGPFSIIFFILLGAIFLTNRHFNSMYKVTDSLIEVSLSSFSGEQTFYNIELSDIVAIQIHQDDILVLQYSTDNFVGSKSINIILPIKERLNLVYKMIEKKSLLGEQLFFSDTFSVRKKSISFDELKKILTT